MADRGRQATARERNWASVAMRRPPVRGWFQSGAGRLAALATPESGIAAVLGFLLARVVLLGELSPFAVALVAAVRVHRPRLAAGAVLGAALGMVTARGPQWAAEGTVFLLLALGLLVLPAWLTSRPAWWNLAVAGTVLVAGLATGAGALLVGGVTPYGLVRAVSEAGLAAFFTLVTLDAVPLLLPRHRRPESDRHRLSALVVLALAVEGLGGWGVAFFRAHRVAGAVIVMMAGSLTGAPGGAAAGVLVGTAAMLCASRPDAVAVALTGMAGLLGGAFNPAGRPGVGLGFLLGTTVLATLTPDPAGVLMAMAEAVVAVAAFMLIPRRALERAGRLLATPATSAGKEPAAAGTRVLAEVSEALAELSAAAARALGEIPERAPESAGEVFAGIAARLCETCPSRSACWGQDYCRTYQAFYDLLARAEAGGEMSDEDLPAMVRRRCSRAGELARTVALVLELKRQEDYWRRRSAESADLMNALLEGMAEVTASATQSVERGLGPEVEERLAQLLEGTGFPAVQVRASARSHEVQVAAGRCPGFDRCRTGAAPAARAVLGRPVVARRECEWAGDGLRCRFVLAPAPGLDFRVGVARLPKETGEVAGDSFAVCQLDPGRLLLGLSNGMGAGARAATESKAALHLLERILRAGFATGTAIRVLNSFMLCRNPDERFATLDLAVVDLHAGDADLVKVGACPSLLRRPHGEVMIVAGAAPPLGILRRVDPQRLRASLRGGDILVMVTDGVADPGRRGRRPDWLARLLERPPVLEPQSLAQYILETGRSLGGSLDDMTVMVAAFHGRPDEEGKVAAGAEK